MTLALCCCSDHLDSVKSSGIYIDKDFKSMRDQKYMYGNIWMYLMHYMWNRIFEPYSVLCNNIMQLTSACSRPTDARHSAAIIWSPSSHATAASIVRSHATASQAQHASSHAHHTAPHAHHSASSMTTAMLSFAFLFVKIPSCKNIQVSLLLSVFIIVKEEKIWKARRVFHALQ